MPKPNAPLDIARAAAAVSHETPERKRFKRLLGQIDAARERLMAWQKNLPAFAAAYEAQVQPVHQRLAKARRDWAFELEQLLLLRKWSKQESATLVRVIVELAEEGLDDADPDPELLALHDRLAEVDHASGKQNELATMKAFFEQIGGIDMGDEQFESPDALLRRAQEQTAQQRSQEAGPDAGSGPGRGRRKKPGATAERANKRAEEDASRATQTARDVYRKLAAALHPDRAEAGATPEQLAQRHDRMAAANAAYAAGDLLALLTLQLQIEQVDIAHAANVAADQVRHFNKVLAEQLREIESEIGEREMAFLSSYGIAPTQRPHPDKLGRVLTEEVAEVLAIEARLLSEQRLLRGEQPAIKRFLKELALQYRMDDSMDGMLPF